LTDESRVLFNTAKIHEHLFLVDFFTKDKKGKPGEDLPGFLDVLLCCSA